MTAKEPNYQKKGPRKERTITGELEWNLNMVVPFLLSLGYREGAASILEAFGFTWDKDGFDCIESSGVACRHSFQFIDKGACC